MANPKWATPNTSTVSNDPQNLINRAKGQPNRAPAKAPTKILRDGETKVKVSDGPITIKEWETYGPKHIPPCINPSCKSYGRPHPNCLCYAGPGGTSLEENYAHGGCVGMHQEKCEHYADGGTIQEQTLIHNDPKHAVDHVAAHHGLLGLLTKTGHSKDDNFGKLTSDFVDHSKKGNKQVGNHVKSLFEDLNIEPNKDQRDALKVQLQEYREHPEKMLDIAGDLGASFPDHAGILAATAGSAVSYLNGLKPMPSQNKPMDTLTQPDKNTENNYNRHLDIAQNPALVLQHTKDGTLLPNDVKTLQTLYPSLYKSMVSKVGEHLIEAKTKGKEIPYRQKMTLSMLLGQPLDSTQTPQAMQAVIISAAPQQAKQQSRKQPKKASGSELSQINKVNSMDLTTQQARQARKTK